MRLDKLLAHMGYGTRKEVKQLLKLGGVKVNDVVIKDAKTHVHPEVDAVFVNGEEVKYKQFIYLMMNKPKGVISATEDSEHETVIDLLSLEDAQFQPFPVGRLDKDTEGLLLLTNDGKLAHELMSPKKNVPKTYAALIRGKVTEADVQAFREGVTLDDGYVTKPAKLTILSSDRMSKIRLTITEGKYHQVKRMFQAVGKSVVTLKREKIGVLPLDQTLALGEYRELTDEEVALLQTS